jgi:hypothetical protein
MTQADSVHSTPPTNSPVNTTRRRFLSQAAGVTVGGTLLALETVSATADAASPMAALASSDVDPIFALIEDYRAAASAVPAAAAEYSRREEMLIEQGIGLSPFISVLDVSGPGGPEPTTVYMHQYIDRLIPADRFSKPNADAHASLDAQIERHKAILGDSEDVLYSAQDAETEVLDTLFWTSPTTIAGVLALLELCPKLRRSRVLDNHQAGAILVSVADALRDLHPNERLASAAGMV